MDNKQDRQFFWKVKDFLNTSPNPRPMAQTNSLKDAASKVMAANIQTAVNEVKNTSSDIQNQTNKMLNLYSNSVNKQKASSIRNSNNITANLFNLSEQMYSPTMSSSGTLRQTRKGFYYTPKPATQPETPSVSQETTTSISPTKDNPTQQAMSTVTNYRALNLSLGQIKPNSAVVGVKPQASVEGSESEGKESEAPSMGSEVDVSINDLMNMAKKAEKNKTTDPKNLNSPLSASSNEILFGRSTGAYR